MVKIVDHNLVRQTLIDGVIKCGAQYGIEGINNKRISKITGINDSLIYRYFSDRDDLIKKAFIMCDTCFFNELENNLSIVSDETLTVQERFYKYAEALWDYSVRDLNYCSFYTRFYYSPSFVNEIRDEHNEISCRFTAKVSSFLSEDVNPDMLKQVLHLSFMAILTCLSDLKSGITEDNETGRKYVFAGIYNILEPFLKT